MSYFNPVPRQDTLARARRAVLDAAVRVIQRTGREDIRTVAVQQGHANTIARLAYGQGGAVVARAVEALRRIERRLNAVATAAEVEETMRRG